MTLSLTFFDKVKYKSTDFLARDSDFFGAGCVKTTDFPLTYPSPASMSVNVGQGTAWVNGYRVSNDANTVSLTFAAANATYPRIDIIEAGYTASTDANGDTTGNAVLQIKQGVAQASPIEPGADNGFVKLYAVSIAANQTTVTSANVTDRRSLVPLNVDGSQISNFSGATQNDVNSRTSDIYGSTSIVLSGGVATKDGTVATQLDVTAANVYFGTGQHVNFAASQNGNFTTSVASTTYYLDYNNDGTTSWGTSHSTKTGYVPIAQVTTDASHNILAVTDERPTTIDLFGGRTGNITLPPATSSVLGAVKPGEGLIVDADGKLKAPWSVKGLSNVLSPSRQSFTRSTAAGQINGNQVASNVMRLEQGRFHKAPFTEEATTNSLSANQSNIETDTTGFSTATSTLIVTGATISRDTSTYYQGSASLKVVTTATSGEGVETSGISASASSKYTASVWVNAPSGQSMQLLMRDYTNSISATPVSFTGTGQWQRVSITLTTGATAVTNLTMAVVTASATAVTFNIDCLQIENKGYMTTWITGGVTRNADSLSYTLDKPLAGRFIHSFVVKPQQNSSVLANRDYVLGSIYSSSGSLRYKVLWRQSDGKIHFIKTPDGTTLYDNASSAITFNANDNIYIVVEDDQTAGQTTLYVQVNNGALSTYTLADTHAITDAQVVYNGCLNTAGSEWNGTIECILHELASGETVSTDEVTAFFSASDWGLGDYPSGLPSSAQIGPHVSIKTDSNGYATFESTGKYGFFTNAGQSYLASNAYYDGNWQRYDTSKDWAVLSPNPDHTAGPGLQIATGLAGSNPIGAISYNNLAQVLSGGYKIQSANGSLSVTANTVASSPLTFPVAFSTTPVVVIGANSNVGNGSWQWVSAVNVTSTGFQVDAESSVGGTIPYSYIAFGQ